MKFLVRADSSAAIGSGHLMRCLALSDALVRQGHEVLFVCRPLLGSVHELVTRRGMDLLLLKGEPTNEVDEILESLNSRGRFKADCLIVDHYTLDRKWELAMRAVAKRIFVIDDLANRQHDCELLLDQCFFLDADRRYLGKVPESCRLLLGPGYSLLRPEFAEQRALKVRSPIDSRAPIRKLLVSMGGGDSTNETLKIIRAIEAQKDPSLRAEVVIGGGHPNRAELEKLAAVLPWMTLHVQTSRMAELMAGADLGIFAGGSISWERSCLGVPSLVVSIAPNQNKTSLDLQSMGYHRFLGEAQSLTIEVISQAIREAVQDVQKTREMGTKSMELTDGKGCERVLEQLLRVC